MGRMTKSRSGAYRADQLFNPERPLSGRLPPLIMLRAFEAAGRTGSMRKAASDIGVSHTVVSRHIQNLEAWIGWKLVNAGPRGITLTSEGEALYAATASAFRSIANVAVQLRSKAGSDELHIWCAPGLATRWLIPRLAEIKQAISHGEILLRAAQALPNFAAGEADLMIGFGDFDALPDGAVPLLQPRMFPVATPEFWQRHGMPETHEDLAAMPLIHEESYVQWTKWLRQAGVELNRSLTGPRLWDASLGLDAALAGQGVTLTSALMAANELESGGLIEAFRTDIRVGGYYLLAPAANRNDDRLVRFTDWIASAMAAFEPAG